MIRIELICDMCKKLIDDKGGRTMRMYEVQVKSRTNNMIWVRVGFFENKKQVALQRRILRMYKIRVLIWERTGETL